MKERCNYILMERLGSQPFQCQLDAEVVAVLPDSGAQVKLCSLHGYALRNVVPAVSVHPFDNKAGAQ